MTAAEIKAQAADLSAVAQSAKVEGTERSDTRITRCGHELLPPPPFFMP